MGTAGRMAADGEAAGGVGRRQGGGGPGAGPSGGCALTLTPRRLGEDAPRLGYSPEADLPSLLVEAEVVAFRVDQHQLLRHEDMISGG